MNKDELKQSTKLFALRVMKLVEQLPNSKAADETLLWLELKAESAMMERSLLQPLINKANELAAIFTATGKTAW